MKSVLLSGVRPQASARAWSWAPVSSMTFGTVPAGEKKPSRELLLEGCLAAMKLGIHLIWKKDSNNPTRGRSRNVEFVF